MNEIIKKITTEFIKISEDNLNKYREIILVLTLMKVSGNFSKTNDLINLINDYKGDSIIANWEEIISDIKAESQEYKMDMSNDDSLYPYQYIRDLIKLIKKIRNLQQDINEDVLYYKIKNKINIIELYHYICYAYIRDYHLPISQIKPHAKTFAKNILFDQKDLYPFIQCFDLLKISDDRSFFIVSSFNEICSELKVLYPENYDEFIFNLTGKNFNSLQAEVEEIRKKNNDSFERENNNNKSSKKLSS